MTAIELTPAPAPEVPPAPEVTFKDMVMTYLHETYPQHHKVITRYVIAVENVDADKGPETQWEYFINPDGRLHTGLASEDFDYYKDNMYPDQLYDI